MAPSIREQLAEYERNVGQRTGRMAVTIHAGQTALGCGAQLVKKFLIAFCFSTCVFGIIVLATGSYARNSSDLNTLIGDGFTSAVLSMGVFLLVFGAIGLCGSMNESRLVLMIFGFLLSLLFVTLLILSAYALSMIGSESALLGKFWQAAGNDERKHVQLYYECCGAYFKGQSDAIPCGQTRDYSSWAPACIPLMVPDLKKLETGFGVTGIFLAVYLLTGIISTFCLMTGIGAANDAKNKKTNTQN